MSPEAAVDAAMLTGDRRLAPADERGVALAAVVASMVVFGGLLLLVPPFFLSFDEAKYIGIGYSLIDGLGPRTPFGGFFLAHAPVWSAVLVLPNAWFGIDPLDTGHLLNAVFGVALVAAAGALGWRVRPAVGGLAAVGTLAITYLHDLTRTARLDVPAAALALLYLLAALRAVRTGRTSWAIGGGLLFALAFGVKEIALPLFPVPFFAAILWGRPWRSLAGTAGWMVLAASAGLSWWFLLVADLAGVVYRLGTPAWTLIPIAAAVVAGAGGGILAARIDDRSALVVLGRRLRLGVGEPGRLAAVAVLVAGWCLALTAVFAGTLEVRGTDILDLPQLGQYAATWLPGGLKLVALVGAVGVALSLAAWRAAPQIWRRTALTDLWLATICSAPLVLLVVEVGEPPRNYLAQLAILAALAGGGWLWLLETMVGRLPAVRRSARLASAMAPAFLVAAAIGASGLLAQHALTFRETRSGQALKNAILTTVAWIRANVPAGEKVAIGSFLSYELALELRGSHPTDQVRHIVAVGDLAVPDAIRVSGQPIEDDWVAVDVAPRNVNEFQAFAARRLVREFRSDGARFWVYVTEAATSAPTIVPALADARGVTELAQWTFPTPTVPIGVHIYAVDPAALAFPANRLVVSPEALERLVGLLEAHSSAARATAATLLERVVVSPASPTTFGLLARLRALAGS